MVDVGCARLQHFIECYDRSRVSITIRYGAGGVDVIDLGYTLVYLVVFKSNYKCLNIFVMVRNILCYRV